MTHDWQVTGDTGITDAQKRMLNAVCDDLSRQLPWHGFHLSKVDWRHMISGTIKRWRLMPGIDTGEGPSFITLGGSSLELSKSGAAEAITALIAIGDDPPSQGLKCEPVKWSDKVLMGLGMSADDIRISA